MKYQNFPPCQDVDTSIEAARKALPNRGTLQREYYEMLLFMESHGATDHEAAEDLNKPLSSICARRNELMARESPLVRDSGRRRPTKYGGSAIVWVAVKDTGQLRLKF